MEIVDSGICSASEQMQKDCDLIARLDTLSRPILRLYSWQKKSITYGHFIDVNQYVDVDEAANLGFDIAKRPTGGGLLFHYYDFSFTIAVPSHHPLYSVSVLESYRLINSALFKQDTLCQVDVSSFRQLCMASPTKYDQLYEGKKVGGSAQRRTSSGFVHQCSIFLQVPNWQEVQKVWKGSNQEIEAMKQVCGAAPVYSSREEFSQYVSDCFANLL